MAQNRLVTADFTVVTTGKKVKVKTNNWMGKERVRCNGREKFGRKAVFVKDESQLGTGK
jgi:hypothetical protein